MPLRVSDNCSMALEITDELIARQSPEAQAIIRALLARLAELEARLNQTSRNSSVPPSSEHPHAKPKRDHQRSRRQRGGQPGHRKHERPLLPPEQCTDVQELKPSNCRRCGQGLAGGDSDPLRHQVWELPVIQPEVIEYRRHRLVCPGCGEATCALLPAGVPEGQSGPRLVAFAGLLMAFFRQSKRRTALFMGTLLHQPCCPARSPSRCKPRSLRLCGRPMKTSLPNCRRNRAWGSTSRRPGKRPPSRGCGRSSPVCSRCSSGATAVQRPSWPRRSPTVMRGWSPAIAPRCIGCSEGCNGVGPISKETFKPWPIVTTPW